MNRKEEITTIDKLRNELKEIHRKERLSKADQEVEKYLSTYKGKRLSEKYSMDNYGTWKILGEDPNCDMGGSHHTPHIDTIEGKLIDVIREAVILDRFWQWGGGGEIIRIEIKKIRKV